MVVLDPAVPGWWGADGLVARVVLAREGARLIVPLPLPVEEYLEDFATEESKAEFRELLGRAEEAIGPRPSAASEGTGDGRGVLVGGPGALLNIRS
ncbi:MAG: hypothetical protein H5T86_01865 [Armatimonadetes bacterium]|nr:hypothetical protein [Armatimonadota bacterium]